MKKKHIITLSSLAGAFLLLLTLALLGKFVWGWFDEPEAPPYIQPDLELGESYYYFAGSEMKDVVLAYPQYEQSDLFRIRVHNAKGENFFFLYTMGATDDYYMLGECDEEGNFENSDLYMPPIADAMSGFMYSSVYDDRTKIFEMAAAVQSMPIVERIRPEGNGPLTQEFLKKYGLSAADNPAYVELLPYARDPETDGYLFIEEGGDGSIIRKGSDGKYYYTGENGEQGELYTGDESDLTPAANTSGVRRIYVGKQTIDDTGLYIYLEGRDVVYTTNSEYLANLTGNGIGYYISPRLVTQSEANYSFMLTPGFTIRDGNFVSRIGAAIPDGATVGITTETVRREESNGGMPTDDKNLFSMIDLSDPGDLSAFVEALEGKTVGDIVDVVVQKNALAKLGESVAYDIFRIRGIIKGTEYLENTGDVLTGNERIVVAYTDGTLDPLGGRQTFYGYIDLADPKTPDALRQKFIGKVVNADDSDIDYIKTYDGVGDDTYSFQYAVTKISAVKGADGTSRDKADYGTSVTFYYDLYENGEKVSSASMLLKLPEAGDGQGQFDNFQTWVDMTGATGQNADKLAYVMHTLARDMLGKSVGNTVDDKGESTLKINIPFAVEVISDFELYDNARVDYCVDYTETLSFAFKNERSIFYGGSLYEIDKDSDKGLYALDDTATSAVVALFEDLTGDETVAIGIDEESINKYGLYAYHLRFVMPFDCYGRTEGDKTYYYPGYEVPYDLYISEKQADGSRYIASLQYNNIVRIEDGSQFDFLEWSFYSKWMQNSLLLVSYQYLRRMVFDLNFSEEDGEDFNSVWGFDITVDPKFQYPSQVVENGVVKENYEEMARLYAAIVELGAHAGDRDYAALTGLMKYNISTYNPSKDNGKTTVAGKLAHAISEGTGNYYELANEGWRDLDDVYGNLLMSNNVDMIGSGNMRTVLQILNQTCYSGAVQDDLTDAEIAEIMAGEYTMRLAMTLLDQTKPNSREQGYTITFYNYGVNSLVVLRDETTGAISSLFYIRSREVVKIARAVVDLSYGRVIDPDNY